MKYSNCFWILIAMLISLPAFSQGSGAGVNAQSNQKTQSENAPQATASKEAPKKEKKPSKDKVENDSVSKTSRSKGPKKMFAVFEIEVGKDTEAVALGTVKIKLHPTLAPKTVENFAGLAMGTKEFEDPPQGKSKAPTKVKRRFYDGLIFHRVIDGFMIQGGDPLGNGRGGPSGPGFPFDDEFHPSLRHNKEGVLSMANAGRNTNGSQFFITLGPTPHLDNKHTIFGEVVEGMDVIKKIAKMPTDRSDKPLKSVVMKSVQIIEE